MNSKRIFLSPPHMDGEELDFVQQAFDSNYIAPLGPQVNAFEKEFSEYVGIKYSAAVSSGTAAMHLALRILGVGLASVKWSSPQRNGLRPPAIARHERAGISRGENLTRQGPSLPLEWLVLPIKESFSFF